MKKKIFNKTFLTIFALWYHTAKSADPPSNPNIILPENLKPELYELELSVEIDVDLPRFWGNVKITMRCVEETNKIILNAKFLEIFKNNIAVKLVKYKEEHSSNTAEFSPENSESFPNVKEPLNKLLKNEAGSSEIYSVGEKIESIPTDTPSSENPENPTDSLFQVIDAEYTDTVKDWYTITLNKNLEPGKYYEVYIRYRKYNLHYLSEYPIYTYRLKTKESRKLLFVTQFGAADARRLFPCFDQINMKSKYRISLFHEEDLKAFTNMKYIDTVIEDNRFMNWKKEIFELSVPMSTHLVSIAFISNFKSENFKDEQTKTEINLWAHESVINQLGFAKAQALNIFQFYTKYFEMEYNLPKLDVFALLDFDNKDEEKYGLIMLKESALLSPNPLDEGHQFDIAQNMCHSFCHQWIGGQVIMLQWKGYWLHEGLTMFFEEPCLRMVFPDKKLELLDSQIAKIYNYLMSNDNYMSSHPLLLEYKYLKLSQPLLYAVTFEKGYLLIRMMNFFMGDSLFKKAIIDYLNKFKHRNSSLNMVWNIFNNLAKENNILPPSTTVKQIMDSWIEQRGLPMITVKRNIDGKIEVKQEQFSFRAEEKDLPYRISDQEDSQKMFRIIPLRVYTMKDIDSNEIRPLKWLKDTTIKITVKDLARKDWFLINTKLSVPLRINYEIEHWKRLGKILFKGNGFSKIDVLSRVQLVSDMFALTRANKLPYTILFLNIKYLVQEDQHAPWMIALEGFNEIRINLFRTNLLVPYQKYVRNILERVFKKDYMQKIDDIDENDGVLTQFKKLIVKSSCTYGVESCQDQCKTLFDEWYLNPERPRNIPIPVSIRGTVFCQAIKKGDEKLWNFLWEKYEYIYGPSDLNKDILEALSCTTDTNILKKYMELLTDTYKIIEEHRPIVFNSLITNEVAYPLLVKFLQIEHKYIFDSFETEPKTVGLFLAKLFEVTINEDELNELLKFKNSIKDFVIMKLLVEESIKKAKINIKWFKDQERILSVLLGNDKVVNFFGTTVDLGSTSANLSN